MTNDEEARLFEMLKRHEGFVATLYLCPTGHLTIGYGHNCEAHSDVDNYKDRTITKQEAQDLMIEDLGSAITECSNSIKFFWKLSVVQQAILLDMCYNMGIGTLLKFKRMLAAFASDNRRAIAREMYNSRWARQTDREGELMFMALTDEWV